MGLKSSFCLKLVIIILGFVAGVNSHAILANECGGPVLQLGGFTAKQGKSQHVNIKGLIGDDFRVSKSHDQNFLVGVGYYFDGCNIDRAKVLYGINAFYLAPTKVKGAIVQEGLFKNLSYQYDITNYPIYLAAKALIHCGMCYDLAIDVGIGPNIVSTRSFKEHSRDGGITIPDAHLFSGKCSVAFSATAGLGCRIKNAFGNFSFEIDYRFFYLGQGELRKNNGQLRNNLHSGNSYANALFFSISI